MSPPIPQLDDTAAPEGVLPAELVRIIEALAQAQARKDYAALYPPPEPGP